MSNADDSLLSGVTEAPILNTRRKREVNAFNETVGPAIEISFVPHNATNTTFEDDIINLGDEEINSDVEYGSFQNLAGPPHKNPTMVIKHVYKTAGKYAIKVRVSNPFNSADTWLCPDIVVVDKDRIEPQCSQFEVDVGLESSEDTPVVLERSAELTVPVIPKLQCSLDPASLQTDYTWKTARKDNASTTDTEWRPELDVCATSLADPLFAMPARSLWYGMYRLTVTMGMSVKDWGRKKRAAPTVVAIEEITKEDTAAEIANQNQIDMTGYKSSVKTASAEFYLEVVKSDLVALIGGETKPEKVDYGKHDFFFRNNNL